jgi:exocyst complex protein 7
MKRVEKALVDLNTTNLRSNQNAIADFNSLLNTGSTKLQELLRGELSQHATPVEPLHYLTKGMRMTAKRPRSKTNVQRF